jgi:hypothetical protein
MFSYYKEYKAHVAPIYQNEIDRHLFATASYRNRAKRRENARVRREKLRAQWASRFARWRDADGD